MMLSKPAIRVYQLVRSDVSAAVERACPAGAAASLGLQWRARCSAQRGLFDEFHYRVRRLPATALFDEFHAIFYKGFAAGRRTQGWRKRQFSASVRGSLTRIIAASVGDIASNSSATFGIICSMGRNRMLM